MSSISPTLEEFWSSAPAARATFDPDDYRHLPEPAQRYLRHAITPGTPLAQAVRLRMHGTIKLKSWVPFTAEQVIRWDRGLIWQATARMAGLPIRGSDRLIDGRGSMNWKLLGLIPVMTASGPDISRAAIGRLAGEVVWLPSALCRPDVSWSVPRAPRLRAEFSIHDEPIALELATDPAGRIEHLSYPRWGNPEQGAFHYVQFGGLIEEERTFGGFTIPVRVRIGWYFGSDRFDSQGEFFRATIDEAAFR